MVAKADGLSGNDVSVSRDNFTLGADRHGEVSDLNGQSGEAGYASGEFRSQRSLDGLESLFQIVLMILRNHWYPIYVIWGRFLDFPVV